MNKIKRTTAYSEKAESWLLLLVNKVNALPTAYVLFILFAGNFLTCIPDGNEENYLQLSKQFVDPHWIYNSFSLTEFPGTRILYQYICGFFLQYISFEMITFCGRLVIIIWYSMAIGSLLKKFALTNVYSLFMFQIVFFIQQSTFGGENFLLGFEPKHIAYGFILLAINKFIQKKYIQTVLFIAMASWFHILLGGWLFLGIVIYQLLNKEYSFKQQTAMVLLYVFLILPFVYYIATEVVFHSAKVRDGVLADWIYCYYRNPHHTAIFYNMAYFYDYHAIGVMWALAIAIITFVVYPKIIAADLLHVNKLVVVISLILLVNVLLAFFDKSGYFVKYYPFRLASIHLFLFYLLTFSIVSRYFIRQENLQSVFLIIVVLFFSMAILLNSYKIIRFMRGGDAPFYEMTEYIKLHTTKDAVIYYADKSEDHTLSFIRESERDRFVVYKFVPAGTNKIFEWYDRMLLQDCAEKKPEYLLDAKKKYKIDYILTTDSIKDGRFKEVKTIEPFKLYSLP